MSLLAKAHTPDANGLRVAITPESAGWQYVGFAAVSLQSQQSYVFSQVGREVCVVILTGKVDVEAGDMKFTDIGERMSVFDSSAPYAVYAPAGAVVKVTAHGAAEVAFCSAPDANANLPPRLIKPEDMSQSVRGEGSNTRYITDVLPQTSPASSLLVVEVKTPSGHSSSYPPHKHDRAAIPAESILEETYYHQINPPQGFAFQRVYTDERDIDESHAVENHDVMMVPRGYHPVVVPHGYESYYLNVMAGPIREWYFYNDPQHEWMLKK